MKTIILVLLFISTLGFAQEIDHTVFTKILKEVNINGMVNYKELKTSNRLDGYIKILKSTDPNKLVSDHSKMAFWINVYNAFTIKAVVDNYPIESINDLHKGGRILGHILSTTVWDNDFININGHEYSLNDVEHEILRKQFKDRRIHFAIVCASISCPKLRNEAYEAAKLEEQLEDQARQFFRDETKNKFDSENKVAYLSKILDWFSGDFGNDEEEILVFISKYIDKDLRESIINNNGKWEVEYLDYDWGLNDFKK